MTKNQRLINDEYLENAEQDLTNITSWWKRKYNLSSNSQEYLTADLLNVYDDYYSHLLFEHNKEFADNPELLRITRGRILNPNFDFEENEAFKESLNNIEIVDLSEIEDPKCKKT